jgi:hypothetical protein
MTIRLKGSHGPQQLVPIVSLLLSSHRLLLSTSFLSQKKRHGTTGGRIEEDTRPTDCSAAAERGGLAVHTRLPQAAEPAVAELRGSAAHA